MTVIAYARPRLTQPQRHEEKQLPARRPQSRRVVQRHVPILPRRGRARSGATHRGVDGRVGSEDGARRRSVPTEVRRAEFVNVSCDR